MYNFDEIIDRKGTNALNTDGFRGYIFHAGPEKVFPYKDDEFVRMWVADMEFGVAPEILNELRKRIDRRIFGYTGVYTHDYYNSFSKWCKEHYDWSFPEEELCFTPGIIPALYQLTETLCNKDEKVLMNTPAYGYFLHSAEYAGVHVLHSPLKKKPDGTFDYDAIRQKINERTKLITIQRSKGYATRPSFSVHQIGELIAFCKGIKPDVKVMVDNCYGEFVETLEPSDLGADMVVGSLIKNPGGGLAPIGGYICGTRECVERCAYRLSAPGLGQEVGANLGLMPALYQGLFLSPTVVSGALKGAVFAANIYERLGYACVPNATESRHDIIQAVTLGSAEAMVAFCKGIQAAAPVDSYVTPEPWAMPGYDSDVIMAAGAFVQGSSIELSADGPIRPPYAVYFQGGLTWYHAKLGILMSLQKLVEAGLVRLPESI